jgi:4-hydroxybenzoate polyprenyltransferase
VFTVIADVSAAFLLVARGPQPLGRWICVVLAAIALYWAGMILNDVFDIDEDRQQRPKRPIPAGLISLSHATTAGWSLLFVGVLLAMISGFVPGDGVASTWLPAAVATGLAVMIVAYDGPLKSTNAAPAAMGACRFLSFLLGAAPLLSISADGPLFPRYVLGIAFGFGVYIMGVTTMARQEATGGRADLLRIGAVIAAMGAMCLALAPRLAERPMGWHVSTLEVFPLMVGMISFPVIVRAFRAARSPSPANIQTTIRVAILTIIPLAACFAVLGAGTLWGLAVFSLVVPSMVLAVRFRVT